MESAAPVRGASVLPQVGGADAGRGRGWEVPVVPWLLPGPQRHRIVPRHRVPGWRRLAHDPAGTPRPGLLADGGDLQTVRLEERPRLSDRPASEVRHDPAPRR